MVGACVHADALLPDATQSRQHNMCVRLCACVCTNVHVLMFPCVFVRVCVSLCVRVDVQSLTLYSGVIIIYIIYIDIFTYISIIMIPLYILLHIGVVLI
jgi:hypothetical protein